jgi:hypothetical protein
MLLDPAPRRALRRVARDGHRRVVRVWIARPRPARARLEHRARLRRRVDPVLIAHRPEPHHPTKHVDAHERVVHRVARHRARVAHRRARRVLRSRVLDVPFAPTTADLGLGVRRGVRPVRACDALAAHALEARRALTSRRRTVRVGAARRLAARTDASVHTHAGVHAGVRAGVHRDRRAVDDRDHVDRRAIHGDRVAGARDVRRASFGVIDGPGRAAAREGADRQRKHGDRGGVRRAIRGGHRRSLYR